MAGNPYWASVVLALHMNGANGSTTFTDAKGNTVTAKGSAQISTAQSKFNGSSCRLDGVYTTNGEHLEVPKTSNFDFGSGDFTIEGFMRLDSAAAGGVLFSTASNAASLKRSIRLYTNTSGFVGLIMSTDGTAVSVNILGSTAISSNTWHHICAARVGNTVTIYLDGVSQNSVTFTGSVYYTTDEPVCIGVTPESAALASASSRAYLAGYIADLEVAKGVGWRTANFTPPAAPFLEYAGQLSGTVRDDAGALCARTVRAYLRSSGALVGSTTSDAGTGIYSINTQTLAEHTVVALDDASGTQYNALVLDRITPA